MSEHSTLKLKPLPNRTDLFYPDLEVNISNVLPTALSLFGKEFPSNKTLNPILNEFDTWKAIKENNIENIVHIIIDAMGMSHFQNYSKKLKSMFETNGITISSVFPTITSTCIASLKLGVMPHKHGIVGQKIFFKEIGNIVDTLTLKAENSRVSLPLAGVKAQNWLWTDFPFTNHNDIDHTNLIENHIANSGLSNLVNEKMDSIGHTSHVDCFSALKRILETPAENKRFIDIYLGSVDAIIHRYTTDNEALGDEIESIETILFKILGRLNKSVAKKTAVFITADHGQENILEENKIVISEEEEEELFTLINYRGKSGRVLHLYPKEGKQDEVVDWFSDKLNNQGVILQPKDYPKFIGKDADIKKVSQRLGEVQIVLGETSKLYFGHSGNYDPVYDLGHNATHGSLSKNELIVPLVFGLASDFKI